MTHVLQPDQYRHVNELLWALGGTPEEIYQGGKMFGLRVFFVIAAAISYATSPVLAQTNVPLDETHIASRPVWKTISLGTYTSHIEIFDALDEAGVHIGDMADEVLHRPAFTLSKLKMDVQLVVLSASDFGFGAREPLASLYARAREVGYELCPPEVAVQLRLQYRDQPVGEILDIAMDHRLESRQWWRGPHARGPNAIARDDPLSRKALRVRTPNANSRAGFLKGGASEGD